MKELIALSLTGHRPKDLWGHNMNNPNYLKIKEYLTIIIEDALKHYKKVRCHSGMALGADTLWAEVILEMKAKYPNRIIFIAEIPTLNQGDAWPKQAKDYYHELIAQADGRSVYYETYAAWKMQVRNQGMIDSTDCLIAVWNGVYKEPDGSPKKHSGTWNAVKYALENNRKIIRIPIPPPQKFTIQKLKKEMFPDVKFKRTSK